MPVSQRSLRLSAILVLVAGVSIALTSCGKKSPSNTETSSTPSPAPSPATSPAPASSTIAPASDFVAAMKSTNPLAYYRLETTSGISEAGGSGFTSKGGVTSSASCAPIGLASNNCALLNGKDGWISTTQMGGIATAGSIMAWVNLATLPSVDGHFFYVAGESQSGNDFDLQFENDDALRFYTTAGGNVSYSPDPKTLVNQWHLIVVTMDTAPQSRVLYWDGQPVMIDQGPSQPNKTSQFTIGASTVFGGRFFDGSIDEVALWNRSLSAAEVAAIYKYTKK